MLRLLVLAAFLALAPAAGAATRVSSDRVLAGPVLAGGGSAVVWVGGHPERRMRLRVWRPGYARPRTLMGLPRGEGECVEQRFSLDGSPDGRIGLTQTTIASGCGPGVQRVAGYRFLAGPVRAAPEEVSACGEGCFEPYGQVPLGALVRGGTLEIAPDGETLVRRGHGGASQYAVPAPSGVGLITAGDYFARSVPRPGTVEADLVLGDARSGSELTRFGPPAGTYWHAVALSDDGVVAAITSPFDRFGPFELEWRSLDDPAPHVLDLTASGHSPLVVADGAIVTEVLSGEHPDIRSRLALIHLGGSTTTIARLPGDSYVQAADWDGRRVVWAQRKMWGRRICARGIYRARPGDRPTRMSCEPPPG